jgi:hypothetical protein
VFGSFSVLSFASLHSSGSNRSIDLLRKTYICAMFDFARVRVCYVQGTLTPADAQAALQNPRARDLLVQSGRCLPFVSAPTLARKLY